MTRRSCIACHWPCRDDFHLEPSPIYVAPHPCTKVEDGTAHARKRIGDPWWPFVDVWTGIFYFVAGSFQQIAQTLRAPGIDVLVYIIDPVFPADPLARHDYVNASAAFQQREQSRQFSPRLEGMFECVIGENDIDGFRPDRGQRVRCIQQNRDTIGFGRFVRGAVGFDPKPGTASETREQKAAAASKITHPRVRFNRITKFVNIFPPTQADRFLLPFEIDSVVMHGRLWNVPCKLAHGMFQSMFLVRWLA